MPSIGSTTQVSPLVPVEPPSSSPRTPSSGRSLASSRDDELLAALVHLGHRVGGRRLRRDPEVVGPLVDDEPAGGARDPAGEVLERRGVDAVGQAGCRAPSVAARRAPGLAVRRLGQQPGAHTEGRTSPGSQVVRGRRPRRGPRPPARGGGRPGPRRRRSSVPGVATRTNGTPDALGGLGGLGVEVVDDLHVVGDEADRRARPRVTPPSAASSSMRSLTSGSSHGWLGGPGARAEHELALERPGPARR